MSKKLKPCPFCGKRAFLYQLTEPYGHYGEVFTLECTNKDCPGHRAYRNEPIENLEKATKAWNRRPKKS